MAQRAAEETDSLVQQQVKPCLLRLSEDTDKDVRYFAGQGLQSC